MTVDISERKKAEMELHERTMQLELAGKAGLVGSYAHNVNTDMMQVSEGYAAIHGLPEGTTESSRSEWKRRTHPEDLARKLAIEREAFRERRGEYGVEYRIFRHGEMRWIESRSFISYDSNGSPQRIIGVNIDITERKRAEEHQRILVAELDHRVKNMLATVSAVASRTQDASGSVEEFVTALDGRIRSMASAHELLSTRRWQGIPLAELVRRELAPYATNNNAEIEGPEVMLRAEAGQAVAMMIHELATNAAKYGAFSTRSGRVSVRWYWKLNGSAQVVLEWQETGGPRVEAPKKAGYGTSVVRELIPYEFEGTVDLSFDPEGFRCRLEIPFDRLRTDSRSGFGLEQLHNAERSLSTFLR
jgi:PAS domain S-box-containing protein